MQNPTTSVFFRSSAVVAGLMSAGLLSACVTEGGQAAPQPAAGVVSGTATYLQRIALPPGHTFHVRLEDVSIADRAAPVIARHSRPLDGANPPYRFELAYAAEDIDPRHSYAVRAEIRDAAGDLVFTTVERHSVITHQAPDTVEIIMRSARP